MTRNYNRRQLIQSGVASLTIALSGSAIGSTELSTGHDIGLNSDGPVIQNSVFYYRNADSMGIISERNSRYLFVDISISDSVPFDEIPGISDFSLNINGQKAKGSQQLHSIPMENITWANAGRKPYQNYHVTVESKESDINKERDGTGTIVIELPSMSHVSNANLTMRSGNGEKVVWESSSSVRERLSNKSELGLEDVVMPEQLDRNQESTITATVVNSGTDPGVFRGIYGYQGNYRPVKYLIPPRSRKHLSLETFSPRNQAVDELKLLLDTGATTYSKGVTVTS